MGVLAIRLRWGTDQQENWNLVKKNYDVCGPLWQEIGPALSAWWPGIITSASFDESRKNMRAWERAHPEKIE
jgi:hypothetical protein